MTLTGRRKAAVLLVSLGARGAAEVFKHLPNETIEQLTVEMADATPARMRIFDAVRAAARDWDGRDPIRRQWPS